MGTRMACDRALNDGVPVAPASEAHGLDLVEGFEEFGATQPFDGSGERAAINRVVAEHRAQLLNRELIEDWSEVIAAAMGRWIISSLLHPGLRGLGWRAGGWDLYSQLTHELGEAGDGLEQGALELSGVFDTAAGGGNTHQTTT